MAHILLCFVKLAYIYTSIYFFILQYVHFPIYFFISILFIQHPVFQGFGWASSAVDGTGY